MVSTKHKNRWIDKVLQGTHSHFSCILPERTGVVSAFILGRFFSGIRINPELQGMVDRLPGDAIIVYAAKYKSLFEFLCYYTLYRKAGLPYPQIGFGLKVFAWQPVIRLFRIFLAHADYFRRHLRFPDPFASGKVRDALLQGCPGFLPLIGKQKLFQRFRRPGPDPIRHLIEIQQATRRPVYIIPQLLFFGKSPQTADPKLTDLLFGTEQRPGKLRRLVMLVRRPDKIFIEISDPIEIGAVIHRVENRDLGIAHRSLIIRRDLLHQINQLRRSITGPVLKSFDELKQNILTSERLHTFMTRHAGRRKISSRQVHKEAEGYINEIAARYNPLVVNAGQAVVGWFLNRMFDDVVYSRSALATVKRMSRKGPLIFIPCHKSHIDYLSLSYVLYANHLPCPHTFAGKNLAFWPMGPLFRRAGAFFVRRTFAGAVFYSKVFTEYIYRLLNEGFNIQVFIEGTRSRTGKLLRPQLGMLSILITALRNGACRDMIFVPVFIGYERVPEEGAYLQEIQGRPKKPESLGQLFRAGKVLKKRYGKIYIRFDRPFSIEEMLAPIGKPIAALNTREQNRLCRSIGDRVMNAIDRAGVVTPRSLAAAVLLSTPGETVTRTELDFRIDALTQFLYFQKVALAQTLLHHPDYAIDHVIRQYVQKKIVFMMPGNPSDADRENYRVNPARRAALAYYKNNSIGFFVPAALTALCILEQDAFQFCSADLHEGYRFLQTFFINEFNPDMARPSEYQIRKTLKTFIDDAILVPHPTLPDTYHLTAEGFRKLRLFAGLIREFFDSYAVVLVYLRRFPKNFYDSKKRLKKIRAVGARMYKKGELNRKEALSGVNYTNAWDFFGKNGVRGAEDREQNRFYAAAIRRYTRFVP